jgi:hypothetical protein
MRAWLAVYALVAGSGCKADHGPGAGQGSAPAPAGQSYRDAIAILCGAGVTPPGFAGLDPVERERELGGWLDEKITNPEARAFVSALADRRDREAQIRRAADTIGLATCRPLDLFASRAIGGAIVPDIAAVVGTEELAQDLPVVVVTATAIVVDGREVAVVAATAVEPAELAKVVAALRAGAAARDEPLAELVIAADRAVTARVLLGVLDGVRDAGATGAALAVGITGHEVRTVPLVLAAGGRAPVFDLEARVSSDAIELRPHAAGGTAAAPLGAFPPRPALAMAEAVQAALRTWFGSSTAGRAPAERSILLVVTPPTTVQTIADVAAAVRASPDGTPLVPRVVIQRPALE